MKKTIVTTKNQAQKKYDHKYYEKNKEQLRKRKLESYYKKRYGITKSEIEEFKRNRKIYTALHQCDPVLVRKVLNNI